MSNASLAKGGGSTSKRKDGGSSDDEYYEPDEEELEEERQDAAAKHIQGLFRAKRARYIIRELTKANYVKEIDSLTGERIYRNRRTGHRTRHKPVFLGDDDLETPRKFDACDGYDPGSSSIPQFALIVTNWLFESPKIPDIPSQVEGDHDTLRETLEHPYFSKFESENCFFVKNATLEVLKSSVNSLQGQVTATMARLKRESERRAKTSRRQREARVLERKQARRAAREENVRLERSDSGSSKRGGNKVSVKAVKLCESPESSESSESESEDEREEFDPAEALILVYICTHAAEISKGKGVTGAYLVASNTSWRSKEELARTAFSLEAFAQAISCIKVRQKVLLLDVVHTDREMGGFKTRHLHPPRGLYESAASLCDAVVIGSCRIGGTTELELSRLRKDLANVCDIKRQEKRSLATNSGDEGNGKGGSDTGSASTCSSSSSGNWSTDGSSSSSSSKAGRQHSRDDNTDSKSDSGDDSTGDDDDDSVAGSGCGHVSGGSGNSGASDDGSDTSGGGHVDSGRNIMTIGRHKKGRSGTNAGETYNSFRRRARDTKRWGADGGAREASTKGEQKPLGTAKRKKRPRTIIGDKARAIGGDENRNSEKGNSEPFGVPHRTSRVLGNMKGLAGWSGKDPRRREDGLCYPPSVIRACDAAYDRAIYEKNGSVFGRTIRDALRGQCIEDVDHPRVTMVHLYSFVRREFLPFERPRSRRTNGRIQSASADRKSGGGDKIELAASDTRTAIEGDTVQIAGARNARRQVGIGGKSASAKGRGKNQLTHGNEMADELRLRTQLPVLAGPSTSAIVRTTACAAPSPPPPPMIPFVLEITRTAVRLTWDDPAFPGDAVTSYELEARGSLRNNGKWVPVFPSSYPTISAKPLSIPHRLPGLGLQYRVRGCNHGGWGEFSDSTEVITTKAWLEDVGENASARASRRLAQLGGPRLILAKMRRYSSALLVQESGFHQLIAEFNPGRGIPRVSLAQEVAVVVANAMTAFSQVRSIQAGGLLLLGWAARGDGEGSMLPSDVVERCLALVVTAQKLHSMDVAIKSHGNWAKSNLQLSIGDELVEYRANTKSDDEGVT